jgi:hypothetical protein
MLLHVSGISSGGRWCMANVVKPWMDSRRAKRSVTALDALICTTALYIYDSVLSVDQTWASAIRTCSYTL